MRVSVKEVYSTLIRVQNLWYDIGLQLDMEPDDLQCIEESYSNDKERLREMITERMCHRNVLTWELIVEALRDPTVGQGALAEEIRTKHIIPQSTSLASVRGEFKLSAILKYLPSCSYHQ